MSGAHWILRGKEPVAVDLLEWAKWFQGANRHVAKDEIDGVLVSTVFIGIDHQWGKGPPLLFETMVFGKHPLNEECEWYATWDEAAAGHKIMVERVRSEVPAT